MKNLITGLLALFMTFGLIAQEVNADDRVNITQVSKPFIGVYAFAYQGSTNPGYPQFQLNNYGGVSGAELATADNSILGMFAFSGHNGLAKKTVGVLRVKSMDDFANSLSSRMDFLLGPNREQRMTIIGNTGFVGIATTNPTSLLDVNGQIRMRQGAAAGYVPVSDADGNMTWTDFSILETPDKWDSSGSDIYRGTGDVGIGIIPAAPLHIASSNGQNALIQSSSTDSYIGFGTSSGNMGYIGAFTDKIDMDFGTGYSNASGKVRY